MDKVSLTPPEDFSFLNLSCGSGDQGTGDLGARDTMGHGTGLFSGFIRYDDSLLLSSPLLFFAVFREGWCSNHIVIYFS